MPEPMKLRQEQKVRVAQLLSQAAVLLIEAQLVMLTDTPSVYEHELSKRLSPELFNLYKATANAEGAVVASQELVAQS